jgi:mycothiol synthase
MSESEPDTQLEMVWPYRRLHSPPHINLSSDYRIRTYQPGDEPRFYDVMALSGWPGWYDGRLQKWIGRILPESWLMAIHEPSGQIVGSVMALHSHEDAHPFGGELGWLCSDPAHRGRGLGWSLSAAVTVRFLHMGYRHIHLYTEDFRLPALKTYLGVGYVPYLNGADHAARWQTVCDNLNWPFNPDEWGY